jgi:hypothetical protein
MIFHHPRRTLAKIDDAIDNRRDPYQQSRGNGAKNRKQRAKAASDSKRSKCNHIRRKRPRSRGRHAEANVVSHPNEKARAKRQTDRDSFHVTAHARQ